MHISSTPLLLTVTRREPELVAPAKPTPRGLQPLSDLDDQESLRFYIPVMYVYPGRQRKKDLRDPVRVIREALAEALVYYYPLAGRLREGPGRKLVVDCTGEGVVFVEADADFTLEDLSRDQGGCLRSPFPSELLYDVPGSSGIFNCPLFLIQVTRFICGGFSFAVRFNHTMVDGTGLVQFLNAVAELARGTSQPSVTPVWGRGLLVARDPPRVTCTHREYSQIDGTIFPILLLWLLRALYNSTLLTTTSQASQHLRATLRIFMAVSHNRSQVDVDTRARMDRLRSMGRAAKEHGWAGQLDRVSGAARVAELRKDCGARKECGARSFQVEKRERRYEEKGNKDMVLSLFHK